MLGRDVISGFPRRSVDVAGAVRADVHRLGPGARGRAVSQWSRRLIPGAQRTAAEHAR